MGYPMNPGMVQQGAGQAMLVPVQGKSGAQMYPVAAGTTVALIDFSSCCFWLKTTDQNGFQQQMREFEFKEITQNTSGDVVSRKEFEELKKMIASLGGKVNGEPNCSDTAVQDVR